MVIMICYDGSQTSRHALKLASVHAVMWKAEMIVVKALERETPLKRAYIEKQELKLTDEINNILLESAVPWDCQLFISSASSGEQLVNFARSEGVDLVFIGVEKQSKVGKLIFGSTAQYVILNSPCPVVTVKSRMLR